jgi:hypothetical protein
VFPSQGLRAVANLNFRPNLRPRVPTGSELTCRQGPAPHFVASEDVDSVGSQRFCPPHQGGVDAHSPRVAPEHGDHRRVGETALHMRSEKAAPVAFDNRHSMQPDLAAGRRDSANGAHQRVDAGRQTFADVRSRIAVRFEPPDDARDAQSPQNMAENHRSNDIAAAGVEKNDAPQLGVQATRLEKIDKGLWRLRLNNAVGYDDVGTMSAAFVGFERRDAKTHRWAVILGDSRRDYGPRDGERRGQRKQVPGPEAGGR